MFSVFYPIDRMAQLLCGGEDRVFQRADKPEANSFGKEDRCITDRSTGHGPQIRITGVVSEIEKNERVFTGWIAVEIPENVCRSLMQILIDKQKNFESREQNYGTFYAFKRCYDSEAETEVRRYFF